VYRPRVLITRCSNATDHWVKIFCLRESMIIGQKHFSDASSCSTAR
jgi:hypothetical protein